MPSQQIDGDRRLPGALRSLQFYARALVAAASRGRDEPQAIESRGECNRVPEASITVADLLAALEAHGTSEMLAIRQSLLAALVALANDK